jgi:hypothetical protein
MNETVKFVLEFFFCNFWHYIGLLLIVGEIFGGSIIKIVNQIRSKKGDDQ